MKKILFYIAFIIIPGLSNAQQAPLYGLYFMDPYLINPAAAGLKNYSVLHLNHRQQWRGIEGAPVTSTLTMHFPVGRTVSLGFNLFNDTRGPLTTNAGQMTFGYRVPLGENHNLRFGLSGGAGWNNIDFDKLGDLDDPALADALDNHFYVTGRFGVLYNIKDLYLGFTFPQIFKSDLISNEQFEDVVLEPFQNYIISANYRINMGENFAFEPWAVYRVSEREPDRWEASGIFWIKKILWLGATYRQDNEFAGMAGFQISDILNFGYAYEPAGNKIDGYTNASHELQLSFRIGKIKDRSKPKREPIVQEDIPVETAAVAAVVATEPEPEVTEWQPVDQEPKEEIIEEPVSQPIIEKDNGDEPVKVRRGNHALEIPTGNYVIVGAFSNFDNARRYSDTLSKKGFQARYGFLSEKRLFYVWLYKGDTPAKTRDVRDRLRRNEMFSDAWYLMVED
jgi:type IX secretion system PorP/SprF family membrane protein